MAVPVGALAALLWIVLRRKPVGETGRHDKMYEGVKARGEDYLMNVEWQRWEAKADRDRRDGLAQPGDGRDRERVLHRVVSAGLKAEETIEERLLREFRLSVEEGLGWRRSSIRSYTVDLIVFNAAGAWQSQAQGLRVWTSTRDQQLLVL